MSIWVLILWLNNPNPIALKVIDGFSTWHTCNIALTEIIAEQPIFGKCIEKK